MKNIFHVKLRFKVLSFLLLFTIAFYFFRSSNYYNYKILAADLGSIPWLYSTIGLIFGVISAFIIQKEWQQWNDLVDAIKGENNALYELWLWSERLPQNIHAKLKQSIITYLTTMIGEGWQKTEAGEISDELDANIREMHNIVADLNETQPIMSSIAFSLLSNVMSYREKRVRYGSSHMPSILLSTLRFATFLMIALCPLIVVKDFELHYIFSISIAFLSYIVYLVSYDLDHPLRPGGWHLTMKDYQKLLAKLS